VRKRICLVATVPFAFRVFMRPHIARLSATYDITLVANGSTDELSAMLGPHVRFHPIAIERKVSLTKDLRAFFALWAFFRAERFDVVHSIMPKSGLLSMVAARLAGVPIRIHMFTGQVWATRTGVRRWFLRSLDRTTVVNATQVLMDSRSQRAFAVENGLAAMDEIEVLGDGSIAGVDTNRFRPDGEARARVRAALGISGDAVVFLFVGRLNREKGLNELASAFANVAASDPKVHLMIIGPDEEGFDAVFAALGERIPGRVHRIGYSKQPEEHLAAADVFCLPSHREGFGSAIIEAAAAGLPTVASRIYGITDAVEDNVTGLLHAPHEPKDLEATMQRFASEPALRDQMGRAARARAMERFPEARLTAALEALYQGMLGSDLT